jgi:SAM-dependent methyltransferase
VFGRALVEYLDAGIDLGITVHRDDGYFQHQPISSFFAGDDELVLWEAEAVARCNGRVLDVGAGAGRHALRLQARGVDVVAIDSCPEAVLVMQRRGVRDVRCAGVEEICDEAFDTWLLLMNGIGIAGTLARMDRMLARAAKSLDPSGQVLLDSVDVRRVAGEIHRKYVDRIGRLRYFGEWIYRLEYEGMAGAPFPWLFVDPVTLGEHASRYGFDFELLKSCDDGSYLARLHRTRADEAPDC